MLVDKEERARQRRLRELLGVESIWTTNNLEQIQYPGEEDVSSDVSLLEVSVSDLSLKNMFASAKHEKVLGLIQKITFVS